ncbi:hypothetical protein EW146_g7344 [Bondarzewia mesenterica]|uniref:Uncharacterized protein n=1 Tax=Bondarzewia mesenterica TaxID=1095465 RepID=A0A4S4LLK4_9AGAM|nr:hypothetical protein EW146_g7344 [Bondarzewia mesenterica]
MNKLSERARLRVKRLLETEEEMRREDEVALVMTEVSWVCIIRTSSTQLTLPRQVATSPAIGFFCPPLRPPVPLQLAYLDESRDHAVCESLVHAPVEGLPVAGLGLSSALMSRQLKPKTKDVDETIRACVSPVRLVEDRSLDGAGAAINVVGPAAGKWGTKTEQSFAGREEDMKTVRRKRCTG